MSVEAPSRPVLRYHGGKFLAASWVVAHFPPHKIYVEPYGGAASVLLRKPRGFGEVYNDLDGEVVNLFRVLRNRETAAELERLLRLTPFAREEFRESYEAAADPVEQARRTVVRCFLGFGSTANNGLKRTGFRGRAYRQNQTGQDDWKNYPDAIPAMTERLQGVCIEHVPAVGLIQKQDTPDTLFYADPPYPFSVRCDSSSYRHEMTDDDHRALAAVLRAVEGMVVLSGYGCPLYDAELYPDWQRVTRKALADGARERTEVLWLNAAASDGLRRRQGTLALDAP